MTIDQYFKIKEKNLFYRAKKLEMTMILLRKDGRLKIFKKINCSKKIYKDNEITGIIYFVDPDLMKNKNYYKKELISLSEYYKN
ncbi:hypothetical protein AGMMS49953_02410 [Endomicrobiia bacterium]|nr:hypothetical protein AGMMS49953_02410 [Endomicrobiia bacterium]